ncbi:MAG TPA: FMN-binding negative transcriptional regulator [Acidimicrobiales bacterium]
MYVPPKHAIDQDAAWRIVREAGAGMLVVATPDGLQSVFVPVVVNDDHTKILSHLARANSWWRSLKDGDEVLGLFLVASAYVSPTNYPSRFESPGVVPTWNYVATEVRGRLTIHEDPEWLLRQVRLVTEQFEAGRSPQWLLDDAPSEYVARQVKAIVGIEIDVVAIQGKAKLSQNRPEVDHDAVRDNLAQGTPAERNVAARMNDDA